MTDTAGSASLFFLSDRRAYVTTLEQSRVFFVSHVLDENALSGLSTFIYFLAVCVLEDNVSIIQNNQALWGDTQSSH